MAGLPVVFKFTAAAIAAERDDGVGPAHRPKHPRALEATADDGFAARFDDSGTHEEMLPPKSGIAHAFGVGGNKTLAVKALARVCRLEFQRVQCTPDLMPADILGANIFNLASS